MKKIIFLIMIFVFIYATNSVTAETPYSTNFEEFDDEEDISLDWLTSTYKYGATNGRADCRIYENAYSGKKTFCLRSNGLSKTKCDWDLYFEDDYQVKKWDSYMSFGSYSHDDYIIMEFYDSYGVKFLMIKNEHTSDSDLTLSYCTDGDEDNEHILGYMVKDRWKNFGFEILSNNSIRYFLGDEEVIDEPYNVVQTKYPKLERVTFTTLVHYLYFDDLTIYTNHKPTSAPGGPYLGKTNEKICFDGTDSTDADGEIVKYSWDFGDDKTKTGSSPEHTYISDGTYIVTLTVTDDDGGEDSASTSIIVTESENNTSSSKTSTPGFGMILFLISIGLFIIWKRKNRIRF